MRNGAGAADVYAARGCYHVAAVCAESADHQRFELCVVGDGIAVSADGANCDVSANGFADAAAVANWPFDWTDDGEHLGGVVVLVAALSRGHSDVWETGDAAGDSALGAV